MSRTHEQFLDELRASRSAVERVAGWLTGRGVPVVVRPTYEAPTLGERADYGDAGDLEILLGVEVKRRSFSFTGKDDFPFPSAIVDSCPSFDKKRPKPYFYVLLNEDMSAGLLVDVMRTRGSWEREELHDGRNGVLQSFYTCPPDLTSDVTL